MRTLPSLWYTPSNFHVHTIMTLVNFLIDSGLSYSRHSLIQQCNRLGGKPLHIILLGAAASGARVCIVVSSVYELHGHLLRSFVRMVGQARLSHRKFWFR